MISATGTPKYRLAAGWIVSASHASASASAGQPSVIRCFIRTEPPASRVTRKGCCMPHGPGPSIAATGVMNSEGSTSFLARQTCSA